MTSAERQFPIFYHMTCYGAMNTDWSVAGPRGCTERHWTEHQPHGSDMVNSHVLGN